jgi:hypothetical protein
MASGEETGVFLRRGQLGEFARRGFGLFCQPRHLVRQIHGKRNYAKIDF